ncbi:MAG: DUF3352 domain-containing protein [Patescibacteria group bacterium]
MERKVSRRIRFFPGIAIAILSAAILTLLSWVFWQKYSAPQQLAKFLPADSTLLFAELQLDDKNLESQRLAQTFANTDGATLLELDSLGFADPSELLALSDQRIGVAFFGEQLDHERFLLVLNTADKVAALDFLKAQTLEGENLIEENYLHQKIYSYPRSRALSFIFWKNDLLLASQTQDLRAIAEAIHIPERRVSKSASYRAGIAKLNPRETGFVYLSEKFIQQVLTAALGGLRYALATPLIELFSGGAATITARPGGIECDIYLTLKNKFARTPLFPEPIPFAPEVLRFLGEEAETFWATTEAAGQLAYFLGSTEKINPAFRLLLEGSAAKFTRDWLGTAFDFENDIAPLFTGASALGRSRSGAIFGIFLEHGNELADWQTRLVSSTGLLAANPHASVLPDGSLTRELVVESESAKIDTDLYAGYTITQLEFPRFPLYLVDLDNQLVFSTEQETLEAIINHYVAEEKGFASLVARQSIDSGNVFYTRIESPETLLLQPFRYALTNLNFTADGAALNLFLGK